MSRDPIGEKGGLNLYSYVNNNPVNLVDPLGLYNCTYSISSHTMTCTSDAGNDGFSSPDWTSGNNGSKCPGGNCQDNPNQTGVSFAGPAPTGTYDLSAPTKPGGGRRHMNPKSGTNMKGRSDIETHGCTNPATCSEGCLAAKSNKTRDDFNDAMSKEEGNNTVKVVP